MRIEVHYFGGFQASWDDMLNWAVSVKYQVPRLDVNAYPYPEKTGYEKAEAVAGFKDLNKVIADIDTSSANRIYIVGHSSGCAIANAADKGLKSHSKIVLATLDGFHPDDDQLSRTNTQVWGAECAGQTSRGYPGFSKGRRHVFKATGCKTEWPLHFSLVNLNASDAKKTSIKTGYADCKANLCWLI